MTKGWTGSILRLDLTRRTSWVEDTMRYTDSYIGGRGIATKIVYDEVDPTITAFDPVNKICFSPGVLTGTSAPNTGRLQISGLQPYGVLGTAGLGAFFAAETKFAGYDTVVAEGKAEKPVYVYICDDHIEYKDACHLWGKDVFETQQMIKKEVGESVQVACIGPGGEHLVKFASVHSDFRSVAGRGGFGAVMGSKNLKAIAVRGTGAIEIAEMDEFLKVAQELRTYFMEHDCHPDSIIGDSILPYQWWRYGMGVVGNFEYIDDWSKARPDTADEVYNKYGVSRFSCIGCTRCCNVSVDIPRLIQGGGGKCTGMASVSTTVWNFDDWEHGLLYYTLVNGYGLDIISTMDIIAFLMELYHRGIITEKDTDGIAMKRGDTDAIIGMIHKIGKQEGFGKLFKNGVLEAARKIGKGAEDYALTVKGFELEPYEYRSFKQLALTTVVGNKGAPVNAMNNYPQLRWFLSGSDWKGSPKNEERMKRFEEANRQMYGAKEALMPTSYEKAGIATWDQENRTIVTDIVGLCKRTLPWAATASHEMTARLLSLATGMDYTEDDLLFAAGRIRTVERAFDVLKGISRKDEILPDRFFNDPTPAEPFKGETLDRAKFDAMLDEYYSAHYWDRNGIPTEEAFEKFGLSSEWEYFNKKLSDSNSS